MVETPTPITAIVGRVLGLLGTSDTSPCYTYILGSLHVFLPPILKLLFSGIMEDYHCAKIVAGLK